MDSQATVSEQLGSLAHLMALARMQNGLEATPLRNATKGRGRILAFLNIKDGVSTKNLATVLALRVSSLNELLAKLEADGYIERRPDPEDGRVEPDLPHRQGPRGRPDSLGRYRGARGLLGPRRVRGVPAAARKGDWRF